jgi:hypothetical protein
MATLNIDMNQGQPEFSEDELDSLRVGEEAQAAEQQRLAGKFDSAEELEKAYIELQRKLGEPKEDEPEVQQEELRETEASEEVELTPVAQLMTDASAEFYETGELTSETIEKFSEMSSKELVETYLEMQKNQPTSSGRDLTESEVNVIYQQAGGQDAYDNLMQWAQESLPEEFTKAYDSVVDRGEAPAIQIALAGLQQQYEAANGVEGNLYTGRGSVDKPDVFRSQSEVIQAMQDRRYDTDPAYRQDVFQKLERSNISM